MAAVTTAPVTKLIKVGFNYRQALLLTAATPNWSQAWGRRTFGSRKIRFLMSGQALTMASLLKNGFTRAQAKAILGL